jgi:hypothetical protein
MKKPGWGGQAYWMGEGKRKALLNFGGLFRICLYESDQQHMQVSSHPQASIVHPQSSSTGLEHPQSKVSSTFVFSLRADFLAISLFVSFFLMLAIFQSSFTPFLRLTTSSFPF